MEERAIGDGSGTSERLEVGLGDAGGGCRLSEALHDVSLYHKALLGELGAFYFKEFRWDLGGRGELGESV